MGTIEQKYKFCRIEAEYCICW